MTTADVAFEVASAPEVRSPRQLFWARFKQDKAALGAAVVILALRRVVDVLALGDDEAAALGVHVGRVRLALVVAATLGTAAAVAVTGLIGFVGIIVPHAIRLVAGIGYRALLPLSAIVGAGFLVLADVVARTALSPAEIPLGVVTAFCGAPFFALVLRSTRVGP